MIFWLTTAALAALSAAVLALVMLRGRPVPQPAAASDLQVYRDQLSEIDRDLARGVIAETEAGRIRAEVSRRILAADAGAARLQADKGASRAATLVTAAGLAIVLILGSLALYARLGAPGYGDLSLSHRIELAEMARTSRPDQATAEASLPPQPPLPDPGAQYLALLERLRDTVANRPDDLQGQMLLARNEAAVGNYAAARAAQERVLQLRGDEARAEDLVDYADMLILAAGGYVSPEAEAALLAAMQRDPKNGPARYYYGLMMTQTGRPDVAFRIWQTLLREGPDDAPWMPPILSQMPELAARAGVEFDMPAGEPAPALPGPSAEDVEAASGMSGADRQAMIRSMVEGLSDRLATEGGPPSEWGRLINALAVLGETDRARTILAEAEQVFAADAAALDSLRATARQAGIRP